MQLKNKINSISNKTQHLINKRLFEFQSFKNKTNEEWFSELCFCILTANSKQKTAEDIQKNLNKRFLTISQDELAQFIKQSKHRFHNNKAKYIIEARKHKKIKSILKNKSELEAREWIIKNIKGLGYKEASHFLRNTGSQDLAILDRHILNILSESDLIERPKFLTPKLYLEIEKEFQKLAKKLNMSPAKLDLSLWYLKTGRVAK